MCLFTAVCVHLDGLMQNKKSEYGSPYLAICHFTFATLSLNSFMSGFANHFTPDYFLNEGQFKTGFDKKLKLNDGTVKFMIQLHLQKK